MSTSVALLATFLSLFLSSVHSCVTLTGFGTGVGQFDPSSVADFDSNNWAFFIARTVTDVIPVEETPIDFRDFLLYLTIVYNVYVPFDPVALDSYGRVDVSNNRRFCQTVNDGYTFEKYREIAIGYGIYFAIIESLNEIPSTAPFEGFMAAFGFDPLICDNPDFNCSDTSTPWGLAYTTAQEVAEFSLSDGFNNLGIYGGRNWNRVPYRDWRDEPYVPRNSPYELTEENRWQPLLEDNNLGFLFNQQHVTPHIGFTGRHNYLDPEYACSLEAEEPNYNYDEEIDLLLERMSKIDFNDTIKMEIENFDNKLPGLIRQYIMYFFLSRGDYTGRTITQEDLIAPIRTVQPAVYDGRVAGQIEYIFYFMLIADVLYESTLVVWREKVKYDLVRPTTLIQNFLADDLITTYAGVDMDGNSFGTQTFPGENFDAYIRTMPHAEYPSGSACVCEAFKEFMIALDGVDDFTSNMLGLQSVIFSPAGSSSVEPGVTPQDDVALLFSSWSQISQVCGQSRLDGGMHFTASVPNAQNLCGSIGSKIFNNAKVLLDGQVPEYIVDFNDRSLTQDKCQPFNTDSDSSSDESSESSDEDGRAGFTSNNKNNNSEKLKMGLIISGAVVAMVVLIVGLTFYYFKKCYNAKQSQGAVNEVITMQMNKITSQSVDVKDQQQVETTN